ncbi:MAG: hypothetical protein AAF098_11685 [Pseudomonadota bacterium]
MYSSARGLTLASTVLASAVLLSACNQIPKGDTALSQTKAQQPPVAKIENVVDTHWGVEVQDPYRYMEEVEDSYVREWFEGQAAFTKRTLDALPKRDEIFERLQELDQGAPYSTSGVKELANGDVFYLRREAGGNLAKLYLDRAGNEQPRLLLDPESIGEEGDQHYSIASYQPSWDGAYLVYGLAQGGSEETTYYVMDLASGELLDTPLANIETAYNRPQWTQDSAGFYYSKRRDLPEDAPDTEIYKQTAVRFHKIGTDVSDDALVAQYGFSDRLPLLATDFPSIVITPGSDYAVLKVKHGDNNEISLYSAPRQSLVGKDVPWQQICAEADLVKDFAVVGTEVYLLTAQGAPRFRLLKTSLAAPDFSSAAEVISASELVLDQLAAARDGLYIEVKEDGVNKVMRLVPGAAPKTLATPRNGAAYLSSISPALDGLRVFETTWIQGGKRYSYDPATDTFTDDGLVPTGKFDAMEGFVAKEVLVTSHDGVKVPLSILHKADLELDGKKSCHCLWLWFLLDFDGRGFFTDSYGVARAGRYLCDSPCTRRR